MVKQDTLQLQNMMAVHWYATYSAVRNADSVVGLFDTASMSFHTNAGTGAFTYG